jgi:hypothetical protein
MAMSKRGEVALAWRELLGALGVITDGVHSNLEYRYVRDVEGAHGLPAAKRQAKTVRESRSQYFDNLYAQSGVAVQLDGQAAHLVEDRWRDIRRDNHGARSGIVTLRYGWSDVAFRPCEAAAEVGAVLRLRGWGRLATTLRPALHGSGRPAGGVGRRAGGGPSATRRLPG